MKPIILILSLLLFSCAKKYDCIKYGPKYKKRHVYEFNYNSKTDTLIAEDIYQHGIPSVYEVRFNEFGSTQAVYPVKLTMYKILKDTVMLNGESCIEWRDKK